MSRRITTGTALVLGTAIIGVATTGVAYAYVSVGASGSRAGNATVVTPSAVTINAGSASATLQPGGTGNLVMSVTNPNSFDVRLTDLAITAVSAAGCTTPSIGLVTPKTYLPATLPAGTNQVTLTGALQMGTDASSDCQGKTFTITLTPTVRK